MAHSHNHSHTHAHGIPMQRVGTAFIIGITLNLLFVAVEAGAGIHFDSLALLSDAGHNLSDVVSLVLSLLAFKLVSVAPSPKYTYGYKKSTILVSLLNAIILLVAVGIILAESIEKLSNPQPIAGSAIAWVAGIGIGINALTALLFFRHKEKDLNIKGAYLHLVADALVSVGVLVSGIIIQYTGWYIIDPIIGIAVAGVILVSTWGLLRDSLRLSLDGVPPAIDAAGVQRLLREEPGVTDVHHLHIWALSTTQNALTAHIAISSPEGMEELKVKIKEDLEAHGIQHTTLEFELPGTACHDTRSPYGTPMSGGCGKAHAHEHPHGDPDNPSGKCGEMRGDPEGHGDHTPDGPDRSEDTEA